MNDATSGVFRSPTDDETAHLETLTNEAAPLDSLTVAAGLIRGVRRRDLCPGDRVIVSTRNSIYSITVGVESWFEVSGGWFARKGRGPTRVEILGCTAGGRALFNDHIAAPGLFMEFGGGLRTTRIRSVQWIPAVTTLG